jgi:adenylate cyclase
MVEDGGHSDRNGNRDPIETLSQRQLGVLELLAKGLTNEEVAGVLGISPTTVRTHVTAVLARLEVSNRTEAAAAYLTWNVRSKRLTALLQRPAIAVLPLVALDEHPRSRAVAGALAQDLSSLFARWCWFPVITLAGARPAGLSLAELGQRLGVTFLVDGTLHRSSSSWRLSVRIDAVATGHCLWTERYDFPDAELFAVQDAVCEAIVAASYPMLIASTQARPRRVPHPHDLQAWELAHEGMRLHAAREATTNITAQSFFRVALEREPDLLLAHFGLGLTSYDDVLNQWRPREQARDHLRACAERCITLAPHTAEGHYLLGRYFQTLGDHSLAARSLEAAIRRNPSFAAAHALLAQALQLSGRSEEALTRMKHAARLGPGSFVAGLATLHFSRGEYVEALSIIDGVLVSKPRYPYALALAAASAHWSGDRVRADKYARALRGVAPDFTPADFTNSFGADVGPVERIAAALKGIDAAR